MTEPINPNPDPEAMIRDRILTRAKGITGEFLNRFALANEDLESGHHRAALGALDGAEAMIDRLRSLLRLLEP